MEEACKVQHKVSTTTLALQQLAQSSALHGGTGKWQVS